MDGSLNSIFIGSSSRGLGYANKLKEKIIEAFAGKGMNGIQCDLWNDVGLFELSLATIESLISIAKRLKASGGYAILLFTPDDLTTLNVGRKDQESIVLAPRDNVVFELGLFTGLLERDHTFCVCPENIDNFRLFSDWQGVTNARYSHAWRGNYDKKMEKVAERIVSQIIKNLHKAPEPPTENSNKKDDIDKVLLKLSDKL